MEEVPVSVVMSAYNAEATVCGTVDSVLAQDGCPALELVVIDDGSSDQTWSVLQRYRDIPNVHLLQNSENLGLTRSLIRGVEASRGTYVARIDAGDRMEPGRLKRQAAYLDAHPKVGVVGSYCRVVISTGTTIREQYELRTPVEHSDIVRQLPLRSPVVHASSMYRRSLYHRAGGYNPALSTSQDYDLWLRMARVGELHNIPEALTTLVYNTRDSITHGRNRTQLKNGLRIRMDGMRRGYLPVLPTSLYLCKPIIMLCLPHRANELLRKARRTLFEGADRQGRDV